MRQREPGWLVVVDEQLQPLGGQTLTAEERKGLTFVRHYEWPMSRRYEGLPLISVPIADSGAQLIMRLPERFRPWRHYALLRAGAVYLPPVLLSILFCWLLYRLLVSPLDSLRRQANALRGNRLDSLLPPAKASSIPRSCAAAPTARSPVCSSWWTARSSSPGWTASSLASNATRSMSRRCGT
jgi:two-component system sensor histidine kinase PfeS